MTTSSPRRKACNLTQQRAQGGVSTDLDVANASAEVRSTAAEIPQFQEQEASSSTRSVCCSGRSRTRSAGELEQAEPIPPVPPRVPVGLPSELARRRPDILQAEAQLHSATADIGVAVANFYPSITLTGSLGLQALRFKDLGELGRAAIRTRPRDHHPDLRGRPVKGNPRIAESAAAGNGNPYQHTVLNAWHEIDNALTAYQTEQSRRDELAQAVAQNRRALGLAQERYRAGLIDFLQVLISQRSLLATQQQLADSTTQVSNDLVALYKALGGGWENDFPLPETAARS